MKWWIVPSIIIVLLILRVLIRGYFWKTRAGERLTIGEFFKRWKRGIEGITPLQSTKTQLMGIWITLSGIIAGIVINCLTRMKNQWIWITVVLTGSLILVVMNFLTTYQKYIKLKRVDDEVKKINKQMEVQNVAGTGDVEQGENY